jgi:hypothetical protein
MMNTASKYLKKCPYSPFSLLKLNGFWPQESSTAKHFAPLYPEESTHFLETRKRGRMSEMSMGNGGKHARARDEKARQSEQDKHGPQRKHTLARDEKARQSE